MRLFTSRSMCVYSKPTFHELYLCSHPDNYISRVRLHARSRQTRTHARTHSHVYTHAHTHAHTHTHARTHARTHTRTHARTHMYTRTPTHTHMHAHTHAQQNNLRGSDFLHDGRRDVVFVVSLETVQELHVIEQL